MYLLYGGGVTRSAADESVLRELQIPFKLVSIDIHQDEHSSDEFKKLNPSGLVPALVSPEGEVLTEMVAIAIYLCERHPHNKLVPDINSPLRGKFLNRLFFISNQLDNRAKTLFYPHRWSIDTNDAERISQKAVKDLEASWAIYENWLQNEGPYALGETFSLLDILMSLWVAYGLDNPEDINRQFPAVNDCYQLVCKRPLAGPPLLHIRELVEAGF